MEVIDFGLVLNSCKYLSWNWYREIDKVIDERHRSSLYRLEYY